jgi:signal peptide peptidase SppA
MNGFGLWAVRADDLVVSAVSVLEMRGAGLSFGGVELASRPTGDEGQPLARRGSRLAGSGYASQLGKTAIVPVLGPLMCRQSLSFFSYDEIRRDISLALADDGIEQIVLDVDSPGGMVAGCDDLAQFISEASSAKPIYAHTTGMMASAAYWIGSATSAVVASRSANIGSVGALIRYMDIEGIFTKLGARVVESVAKQSPSKVLDPESDDGKAELQAIVDGAGQMFVEAVAANRSVSVDEVMDKFGQGRVFKADDALARGMIDRLQGFDKFLAEVADRQVDDNERPDAAAAPYLQEGSGMTNKQKAALGVAALALADASVTLTAGMVRSEFPEIAAELAACGSDDIAKAEAAAATAERERITGILAHSMPGAESLIADMVADGSTTPDQAAAKVLGHVKANGGLEHAGAAADESNLAGLTAQPVAGVAGSAPASGDSKPEAGTPEAWRAEWSASAELQADYVDAEDYVAAMNRQTAA